MRFNYISPSRLDTGNIDIEQDIYFLKWLVKGDISNLLDGRGNISCQKIDEKTNEILNGLDVEIKKIAIETLKKVRFFLKKNIEIAISLDKCNSLTECRKVIESYGKGIKLDIVSLNTILHKCNDVNMCRSVKDEFGKGITLNITSLNNLLNKCSNLKECKEIIKEFGKGITLNVISLGTILKKCNDLKEDQNYKFILEILYLCLEIRIGIKDEGAIIKSFLKLRDDNKLEIIRMINNNGIFNLHFLNEFNPQTHYDLYN